MVAISHLATRYKLSLHRVALGVWLRMSPSLSLGTTATLVFFNSAINTQRLSLARHSNDLCWLNQGPGQNRASETSKHSACIGIAMGVRVGALFELRGRAAAAAVVVQT